MKVRTTAPTREQTEQRLRDMRKRRFNFLQPAQVVVVSGRLPGRATWAAKQARKAEGKE